MNGMIEVGVLRSPTRKASAFSPPRSALENGRHEYEFAVIPYQRDHRRDSAYKLGARLNAPPLAVATQIGSRLTAQQFNERIAEMPDIQIVDVRNPGEVADGIIPDAITIPVGQLPARTNELDATRPTVVYCAGGYRSSVAASVLRHRGFVDVSDIIGGYGAWTTTVQSA